MSGLVMEVPLQPSGLGTAIIAYILGLHRDNGKENGNYYITVVYILGLYRDNGEENGNY